MYLSAEFLADLLHAIGDDTVTVVGVDGGLMRLFKNDLIPNRDTPRSAYEEADFTGYAPVDPVTWGVPNLEGNGHMKILGSVCSFTATDSDVPNSIYGYYLTGDDTTTVSLARRFAEPVQMAGAGRNITIVPSVVLPSNVPDDDAVLTSD